MRNITLLLFLPLLFTGNIRAQSPGGVTSPELWFQTEPISKTNLRGAYHWVDYSGDSLRLNVYDKQGAVPSTEFTTGLIRFYNGIPALEMNKIFDYKSREVHLKHTNLSQATIFGVFAPYSDFNTEMLLYGFNGRPGQGFWLSNDKIIPSRESGKTKFDYGETEGMDLRYSANDAEANENLFRERSMRIATYYRSVPPATNIWGERDQAVITFGSTYNKNNFNNTSSFDLTAGENTIFSGFIPEVIAYNRLLTPLERRKVNSYLAVKYGISLPVSIIGSNEQLLWDYTENSSFNNRIAGIYKDNASGLDLKEASTSYEELPNYSDQLTGDYFLNGNPYNRSSGSRLLVIGRQFGNKLDNTSYIFWGDNGKSIKQHQIEGEAGILVMDRQWLVKTNIAPTAEADKQLDWQVNGLLFTTNGFVSNVVKEFGTNKTNQGTAYTKKPLFDENGYIGISNVNYNGSTMFLKFGSNQAVTTKGSHDYGYYVDASNRVYPIIRGVVDTTMMTRLFTYSTIEMQKEGNLVYMRIDGTRNPSTEIVIDLQDTNKQYYGMICLTQGFRNTSLSLCHGGFADTGNRVELSFSRNRASEYKENEKGKSYLVIDRSGTGNFNKNDIEYYEVSEIDALREKVIFNNVFFNTRGNGKEVMTFAYCPSGLTGDITTVNPGCNEANGEVKIIIKDGMRAFDWTLTDKVTGEVVQKGREYTNTIHIKGLKGGRYDLNIKEGGGFNIANNNTTPTASRARTTNALPVIEGWLEWTVTSAEDTYMVGYTTFYESPSSSKNIVHYGLKKQGNKIYKIVNGKLENTNVTVQFGDVLRVYKNMSKVIFYKNGEQFSSNSIKWYDVAAKFYGLIDMSEGKAEILNIKAKGFDQIVFYNWEIYGSINMDKTKDSYLNYEIFLDDPCGANVHQKQEVPANTKLLEERLKVINNGTASITAEVTMDEAGPVTFIAYNIVGNMVAKKECRDKQTIQRADLYLGASGVYIIKAITANGEYSRKVLVE